MELSAHLDHMRQSLHELTQPLAAVTGLVDLLLLEMEQDSSYFWEIRMISEQLERVLGLIGEIRQMAKEATEELLKAQQTTLG